MTTREPHEASRRDGRGRDSHGRRTHSSSRSRRDDPSPRRRRDGDRRRESDRSHHRSRDEEHTEVADHDQKRNGDTAQGDDPPNAESKSASDVKNGPSTRHERSPRGTKRFSESREAWRPRSFFQPGYICARGFTELSSWIAEQQVFYGAFILDSWNSKHSTTESIPHLVTSTVMENVPSRFVPLGRPMGQYLMVVGNANLLVMTALVTTAIVCIFV